MESHLNKVRQWAMFRSTTATAANDVVPELMTRMRPAAALGTINAVTRSMWFQSLYAEADF